MEKEEERRRIPIGKRKRNAEKWVARDPMFLIDLGVERKAENRRKESLIS